MSICRSIVVLATMLVLLDCAIAQSPSRQEHDALGELSHCLQRVIAKVAPATVILDITGYTPLDDDAEPGGRKGYYRLTKAHTLGSGVIVDSSGYIVTNAHVVEGARRVRVSLDDSLRRTDPHVQGGETITFDGHVAGVFQEADLALVKIDAKALPTIGFADSDAAQPGELVFAIGSPEGFKNSVSIGIISAVGRESQTGNAATFIQTDAAISPGSSGGALVNADGDLLGITTFTVVDRGASHGLGFALPSKVVRSVFEELKTNGHVTYGGIGAKVQNVTPTLAQGLHLAQEWGVIVSDITGGSSAEKAGMHVGDVIVAADGQRITTVPQFALSLYGKRIGDHLQLEVLRASQSLMTTVTVDQRLADPEALPDSTGLENGFIPRLGIVGAPLSQHLSSTARSTAGVVVTAKLGADDADDDLLPGDIIRAINQTMVTSVEGLRSAVDKLDSGMSAVLQVERKGELEYVALELD